MVMASLSKLIRLFKNSIITRGVCVRERADKKGGAGLLETIDKKRKESGVQR